MKTAAQIASHPKARLYRELVATLRASGSVKGAEQAWLRFRLNARLWRRIVNFGLGSNERQFQLTKVAFPDSSPVDVDAALNAGNNLNRLYELACGRASIVKDFGGQQNWEQRTDDP